VELNRDKQSAFVTEWLAEETQPIAPVFVNFEERLKFSAVGPAEVWYVKNSDNRLFNLSYDYEKGRLHDKRMPLAMKYLGFLGTSTLSAEAFSKKMYALGCSFSTSSSDKKSYISLSGPSENLETAMKMIDDLMNNPVADEAAFRSMIENEKKRRADSKLNNRSIGSALLQYTIYGADNPQLWNLSNAELNALKSSDLLGLIRELKNTQHVVDYYGPLELPDLQVVVHKNHTLPTSFAAVLPRKEFTIRENVQPEVFFTNYSQVQASIYWINKSSVFNPAELPMMEAFNQYFGGDMSSVVFQNIREAKALAYSTFARYYSASEAGKPNYTLAFIGTQADKFHDAVAGMNELLTELPLDENVFELAKESIKNRLETERIDDEGITGYYQTLKEQGISLDPRIAEYELLPRIDILQISDFHKAKLSNRKYSLAVMADASKISVKDLEKYGKVTVLSLEEIFGY
jgi:predicted Zn-dependent peptidase